MIYLDNSATTFPKPASVIQAMNNASRNFSFNPGRGGYRQSLKASEIVYNTRSKVKSFFNAPSEESVIFTYNCTHALNMAVKGVLNLGDHAVISSFEHNAVLRPIQRLADSGFITYTVAEVVPGDDERTVENFRKAINSKTRLFVCTHASNVFGIRLPVERLCALAHSYGILFCLDAAQSAGLLDIDVSREKYDFVCCAGHKYLYGPMGTGILIINNDTALKTLIEGGTGSESADSAMPLYYPDRLEAGTANVAGIAGLGAAIDYLSSKGIDNIVKRETRLVIGLKNKLQTIEGLKVYENYDGVPVFSLSIDSFDSERVARYLSEHSDIAVRSGLHCAPLAHRQMGSLDSGTVRVAPGIFTTENDTQILFKTLRKMIHSA
jgi:cysteine desulfurase family protein